MRFSEDIVQKAWERSDAYCECTNSFHGHDGRCNRVLLDSKRGDKTSLYGWQAHSISGRYLNSVSDCEILCWDCYSKSL